MKRRTKKILLVVGGVGLVGGIVYLATRSAFTPLAWGEKFTPEEREKIFAISKRLKMDPSVLTSIMFAESGLLPNVFITKIGERKDGTAIYKRSTNPDEITDASVSGGLIGFTRSTANALGISFYDLLHLSRLEQLDYVEKFYQANKKAFNMPDNPSLHRVYMTTFLPAYAHKADEPGFVLASRTFNKKIYNANPATDRDGNGEITVQEAMSRIDGIYNEGMQKGNVFAGTVQQTPVFDGRLTHHPTGGLGKKTSGFGYRTDPVNPKRGTKLHAGIDIAGLPEGSPIYAAGAGTVVAAGYNSGSGNFVKIDHGNKIITKYGHMYQLPLVQVGQLVQAGQVLGGVGTTGYSTGNHLHFAVSVDGKPVDPETLMRLF